MDFPDLVLTYRYQRYVQSPKSLDAFALMGGWSGYDSQRPPGMPVLVRGLRQFEATFIGWKTARGGLVYTQ
jgi:hypothetical protein